MKNWIHFLIATTVLFSIGKFLETKKELWRRREIDKAIKILQSL